MQIENAVSGREFDRIWALFEETNRQIKETGKILAEQFLETARQFKETDKQFKETDRKLKETDEMLSAKFKETDEKFKETDRMLSAKFKETQAIVGRLGNRWGEFVEGLVVPAVIQMFGDRGIEISRVFPRAKARIGGATMEIDVIGDNSTHTVVVEVKSKPVAGDVKKFIEKIGRFRTFFPAYDDKIIIGAIAGITIDESVINFAGKEGLYVIAQKGESVKIVNPPDFVPKTF